MLNYGSIRNLYKSADRINSEHLVVAEWNMNKYQEISRYGLYIGNANNLTTSYTYSDPNIIMGQNYLIYDDGTKKVSENQEYFSQLSSVFRPNRPDPGIVLLQKFGNMTICPVFSYTKATGLRTDRARYYPYSENRTYDYFNSAKIVEKYNQEQDDEKFDVFVGAEYGVSNPTTGNIANANPFVVYLNTFAANKITIKVQDHLCVPENFKIDILIGTTWTNIYTSTSSADFNNGILNIYFNNGTWSKTVNRVTDINELTNESSTQVKQIRGVRFGVSKLTLVPGKNDSKSSGSLELIEISPRLEMDLTSYTESFSFNGSIGDSTAFGLPVGSVVSSTGNISLSNEDTKFLFASTLSTKKMLNQDVKFTFYQKVYVPADNNTYVIPLKTLFSNDWTVGEDYSVSVSLEDGLKFLREINAPDLLFSSQVPLSVIILMILDNVGITGLEFKKSSNAPQYDKEDTLIKTFFCKKEQTVAEVLEQLAIATQCSMFFDAVGKLNVLTKEKLVENAELTASDGSGGSKTDFWFVSDETYTSADAEYAYINGYNSNIASFGEQKLNPITDGEINYHSYGPQKAPLLYQLDKNQKVLADKLRQDEFPMNSLAFSNFGYANSILWQPASDNVSTLWAVNLSQNINNSRLKDVFNSASYSAYDEEDAVRQVYTSTNNPIIFSTEESRLNAKKSLIVYLDTNEGLNIPSYNGLFLVDSEYIRYNGKLFYIASTVPGKSGYIILFSEEEMSQLRSSISKGDSLSFRGLVIDIVFKIIAKDNDKYVYEVVNDGRAQLGSTAAWHYSAIEESDGVDPENRFKLMLGESKNYSDRMPGDLSTTTKFNFLEKLSYRSLRKSLGTIPPQNFETYLGFLKISGPISPKQDTDVLSSINGQTNSADIIKRLNDLNKLVDSEVPGNFDDYIYLQGERAIYGQKINLGFTPNVITTRMRLYSSKRNMKNMANVAATNSSIAGIGFGLNANNEGYFLEVESATSKNDFTGKEASFNNLRFYKVTLKNGKYVPELLEKGSVGAYTTIDTSAEIIKADNVPLDPVFEIDIRIEQVKKSIVFTIVYGDTVVATHKEPVGESIGINSKAMFIFVRNDSQAIYEYIAAAAKPTNNSNKGYWKSFKELNRRLDQGSISVNKAFLFKNKDIQFYFNDFAKVAREVKELDLRFTSPAYVSALLDVSKVNPKYLIKKYTPTAFGAKLTLVNISGTSITIGGDDSQLPLYITGIAAQELSAGKISMKDLINSIEDANKRTTEREKNIAIYGQQGFTLDSQYIQSLANAKNLMRWIMRYCSRQRLQLSLEIFPNPLIELGDKVKIFDKSRGYYQNNSNFGAKTFVVSSISHSVASSGPSMTVELIEVGEQ